MEFSRVALLTASALLPFIALAAGCGSSETTGAGGAGSTDGAGGATTSGPGPGSSSSTGDFDAGAKITTVARNMSPDTVEPGKENTQCVTVNLNNPEGAYVRRIRADLSGGRTTWSPTPRARQSRTPSPRTASPSAAS